MIVPTTGLAPHAKKREGRARWAWVDPQQVVCRQPSNQRAPPSGLFSLGAAYRTECSPPGGNLTTGEPYAEKPHVRFAVVQKWSL